METMNKVYSLRFNENDKQNAEKVFKNLGMSFNTGMNVLMKAVVREQKIPFILEINDNLSFNEIMENAQEEAKANGIDNMTMEEIDAEISAYRREKRGL